MSGTIFALATAPGRAAVAMIRISGPRAHAAVRALAGRVPPPRRATVRRLRIADGTPLDEALILIFRAPESYTGEDVAELHLHGGQGVVDAVTEALQDLGLRLAEPGEFTRRAFENGKLDLDQAEAIADLVDAETAAQARQALGQFDGRLGDRYAAWRESLLNGLARLEAAVDFPDEEVPADVAAMARAPLAELLAEIDAALADESRGRRVRDGYRVALVGAPNSGKSSLLNALAGRDAAIVTPVPGATRDVIEVFKVVDGFKVLLADTAGVRATAEPVEQEGVRRARAWADAADWRIWVVDGAAGGGAWRDALGLTREGDLCLINKADLPPGRDAVDAEAAARERGLATQSTSLRAEGAGAIEPALARRVRADLSGAEFPAATRARHLGLLREARAHLARALDETDRPELAAEDARLAARDLARISGRIDPEDVLGRVFATFCIGK